VIVPPADFLPALRRLCDAENVLLVADEIQSGLGRTGTTFACDLSGVVPDVYLLGKALGGGIVPLSAVVANRDVLGVLHPGQHGSTFGGNPLACAIGRVVVQMLSTGEYQERSEVLGKHLHDRLEELQGSGVTAVRGMGLWAGVDVEVELATGREICEALLARGVLVKDTHGSTIRIAPPLVIERTEVDLAVDQLGEVLAEFG
jgi:ornithine--oxo-acid transaminase